MDCTCQAQIRALQEENERLRLQLRLMERDLQLNNSLHQPMFSWSSQQDTWDDVGLSTASGSAADASVAFMGSLLSMCPEEIAMDPDGCGPYDHGLGHFTANIPTMSGIPGHSELLYDDDDQPLAQSHGQLIIDGNDTDLADLDSVSPAILHDPAAPFALVQGFHAPPALGILDQYIMAMGSSLKSAVDTFGLGTALCHNLGVMGVLWIVQEAWPQAEHYWKVTASFQGFLDIEMWRNFPCAQTYQAMHPYYRPTPLQMCVPHHPLIDWLPWPELRDKLIEQQDDFPEIELVCRAAIHNVVAHRRSSRFGKDRTGTSFRVWDLCILEEQSRPPLAARSTAASSQGRADLTSKPKSASVMALEKAYQLEYDDFCTQKLHSDFFDMFPSLYCDSLASSYTIKQLPGAAQSEPVIGRPKPMDAISVQRLRTKLEKELPSA